MAAQPGAPGEPEAQIWDEKGDLLPKVKPDKKKDPAASKRKSKEAKRASKEAMGTTAMILTLIYAQILKGLTNCRLFVLNFGIDCLPFALS